MNIHKKLYFKRYQTPTLSLTLTLLKGKTKKNNSAKKNIKKTTTKEQKKNNKKKNRLQKSDPVSNKIKSQGNT